MIKAQNLVKNLKKEVIVEIEEATLQERSMTQRLENPESEHEKKSNEDELSKVQRQDLDHAENTVNEDVNQELYGVLLEQEHIHTEVHSKRKKIPVIDKSRFDNAQSSQEEFEENLVSQGFKRKVVQLATLKYQVKALSMLGEIGVG